MGGTCFSNEVGQVQRSDCIHSSLGRKSTANCSSAVAASASAFLFYYALLFDDSPRAECQQAGIGTGLATGGIYCHDAGDRLLVHYSSIFESHQQPSGGVERVPKYLRAEILLLYYLFGCHTDKVRG